MKISAELSFYPLKEKNYSDIIGKVIENLEKSQLEVIPGPMGTVIYGETDIVLKIVKKIVKSYFEKYEVIFNVKYSNACMKK